MNDNQRPFYYNTWVIVVAFIVFWPVGIALLIGRINSNKRSMFDGSKTTKVCLAVGAVLILLGISTFSGKHLLSSIFYIAGGAALVYYANQNKKKVQRYKSYIDLVANQKVYSIDTISNTMNVTYDMAKTEIQKLITMGSFRGANINELTRCIEIAAPAPQPAYVQTPVMMQPMGGLVEAISAPAQAANVTAVCPGCGGTMVARKGETVECDYCGKIFTAN